MDEHPPLPTLSPSRGGRASPVSPLPVGEGQGEGLLVLLLKAVLPGILPLIAGLLAPELGIFAIGRDQGLMIAALNHSASL